MSLHEKYFWVKNTQPNSGDGECECVKAIAKSSVSHQIGTGFMSMCKIMQIAFEQKNQTNVANAIRRMKLCGFHTIIAPYRHFSPPLL